MNECIKIPEIPIDVWTDLLERVLPVITKKDGKKFYLEPCDPCGVSYIWCPKFTKEAVGLEVIATFKCLHGYGYYGLFKPSINEVLCQIPIDHRAKAVAFEITEQPRSAEDFDKHRAEFDAGFHVSQVTLYTKGSP